MLKLKRDIGLFGVTTYILGVIVGAGIYVIIGKASAFAGNSLWLAFLIAALIAACTGLSYAELSSSFPCDSAEYKYTERAFKDRKFSFGIVWIKFITHIIAISAVSLGFGGYLALLTGWNFILCAIMLIVLLTSINFFGVKKTMGVDTAMVIIATLGILFVIWIGIPSINNVECYLESASGFSGIFTGAALVFFAFLGFEIVGNIGEEVKNPKKNLPLAVIISISISVVLYILVAIIAVSVVPWQELASSASPLSDVMTALIGSKAGTIIALMALAATGSTVLGLIISTSRMMYGLAKEKSFPSMFLKLTKKRRVPYIALLVCSGMSIMFILPGDITSIVFLANFGALFIFMIVNLCLIVLRYSHSHIPRGFSVPFNIGKFPIIPAIGMISCIALMFSFTKKMFFGGIMLFLSGILIYMLFGEKRKKNHVRKRIEAKYLKQSHDRPIAKKRKSNRRTKRVLKKK